MYSFRFGSLLGVLLLLVVVAVLDTEVDKLAALVVLGVGVVMPCPPHLRTTATRPLGTGVFRDS